MKVGGKRVGPEDFDHIDRAPVFSPNGKHVAYVANRGAEPRDERFPPGLPMYPTGGKWHVVTAQGESPGYDEVRSLTVDAKGQVAYAAKVGGEWTLIYGEKRSRPFDELGAPVFSEDGKLSFGALDGRKLLWIGEPPERSGEESED